MRKTAFMMVALVASNLALAEAQYTMDDATLPDDSDQPTLNSTPDLGGIGPIDEPTSQQPSTDGSDGSSWSSPDPDGDN